MSKEFEGRSPSRRVPRSLVNAVLAAVLVCFSGALAAAGGMIKTPAATIRTVPAQASASGQTTLDVDVAPVLYRQLAVGGRRDFAVEFRDRADLSAAAGMSWQQRGRYVYERLHETAERSQSGVRRMLSARGFAFEAHWIKNTILVRQGDMDALRAASAFAEVRSIRELPATKLIEPERPGSRAGVDAAAGVGDNIHWIGADQAWAQGTTGNGVTVGVIDTGVLYTHQALRQQYRGYHDGSFDHDYNWFAPSIQSPEPISSDPHGSHVTGTIAGDDHAVDAGARNRIGVAPGAQWIACLGFPLDGDSSFALLSCGEFMLAPTRTDGSAADPDRRPQVVNNSWSEGNCNGTATPFYADMVEAWVAAGIFPVFAAGNAPNCGLPAPPGLSSVSSPASLGSAFAVGSTGNHDGEYATHSLWGPTTDASAGLPIYPDPRGYPQLKPQVVAPGVDIRSAMDFGEDVYATMSGTSMSSPHITGLVALMLEAGECLAGDYATLGTLIMQTARPIDYDSGGDPPPGPGNIPNYATGWGEIDAARAVDAAARACGPQGFMRGRVTTTAGAPIAGAKVELFVDEAIRVYQLFTEADGSYIRRLPVNIDTGYTVRVSAYGYLPSSESGVRVSEDATTVHDVSLAAAAVYKISGRVTDAAAGWPLHAKIIVSGYPDGPLWTDPVTGRYSIRLPEGAAYRFDVGSDIAGYQAQSREVASVVGGGVQDFALPADPVRCSAPGYSYASSLLSEGFENNVGAPPGGWSISSAGLGWLFGTSAELSGEIFEIPQHGRFAASNDELGAGGGWENDGRYDYLVLPTINLAGTNNPVLRYRSFYAPAGGSAHLEASTDGGTTWFPLGVPKNTDFIQGWTDEAVSLAPAAAVGAKLRFHADDGTIDESGMFGGAWAVDDIAIVAGCTPPAQGGLIVGHVRDANTGSSLNGAEVHVEGGDTVVTASSADPGVGDGFFAVHGNSGTPTVQATRGSLPAGYGDASATPGVTNGSTVLADLALPAGRLRLFPSGPTGTVELGTTASAPFTVSNSGTLALSFGFEGAVVEEHFEEVDFPPSGWNVVNHGSGCVWTRNNPQRIGNYAGGDGLAAAMDMWDDCRDGGPIDTSLITAPIDLGASHTASMGFFLSLSEGADNDPRLDVDVSTNGGGTWTTIFSETHDNNGGGPGALIELDLSAFAGASDVRARFHYTGTPPWGHIEIDQVHLFNGIGAHPLLDIDPEFGALAPGESRELTAVFDATSVAQPGVYTVPVRVAEDTPYAWPFGDVEASMTVTAPASYGSIAGTVQSLGYCDANPVALGGATIRIQANGGATYTTTSAADGSYRYWLAAAQGPFTLTVEAPDHLAQTRDAGVDAGAETVADFALRPLLPCLTTDPAVLESTVQPGQSVQRPFDLLNLGAAGADWTLRVGGDPAVLSPIALSQTTSPTPADDVSFACINPANGFVLENRYFRVFPLADRGTPDQDVIVSGISFGVESAQSSAGIQPITLRLYTLEGELALDHLTLLGEQTTSIANMELQRVSVAFDQPLTVAGDAVVVAEIYVPDGSDDGNAFYPGANSEGESAPAYWISDDCGATEPVSFPDVGFGWVNLVLEIDTLASDPCGPVAAPVDWLALSPLGGTLAADASTPIQATFTAGGHDVGGYRGTMCLAPGQTAAIPTAVPVGMIVGNSPDAIFANGFDG
jgi:subtilase family protein/carboxypeptidase family protein